jgi:hypothetical protein
VELVAACRGGKSEGSDRALGRGVVEDLFAGDAAGRDGVEGQFRGGAGFAGADVDLREAEADGEPVVEQQLPEDVDAEDLVIGQ